MFIMLKSVFLILSISFVFILFPRFVFASEPKTPISGFLQLQAASSVLSSKVQDSRRYGAFANRKNFEIGIQSLYLSHDTRKKNITTNLSAFFLQNQNSNTSNSKKFVIDTAYIHLFFTDASKITVGLQPSFFQLSEKSHLPNQRLIISYSLIEQIIFGSFLGISASSQIHFFGDNHVLSLSLAQEPQGDIFSQPLNDTVKKISEDSYQSGFRWKWNNKAVSGMLSAQYGMFENDTKSSHYFMASPQFAWNDISGAKIQPSLLIQGFFLSLEKDNIPQITQSAQTPFHFSESGSPYFWGISSTLGFKISKTQFFYRISWLNKEMQKSDDEELNAQTPFYVWSTWEHSFAMNYFFNEYVRVIAEYTLQTTQEGLNTDFIQPKTQKVFSLSMMAMF